MTKQEIERGIIKKIKVVSAGIIVSGLHQFPFKPYYEIKYLEVGNSDYTIGFGSYNLDFVIEWLNTYFEKVADEYIIKCDYEQLYVDSIKLINQLQQENEELKAIDKAHQELVGELINEIKELKKENEKQKEILNILRPHLKMVQDVNGLVGLEYDMSALIMKEKKLIQEWLEND